uniref:Uncharacterized protein n=1 Tax=Rhizophora mucronata TaxID=61149 RepID=A0A2P2MXR5_RHIMU
MITELTFIAILIYYQSTLRVCKTGFPVQTCTTSYLTQDTRIDHTAFNNRGKSSIITISNGKWPLIWRVQPLTALLQALEIPMRKLGPFPMETPSSQITRF